MDQAISLMPKSDFLLASRALVKKELLDFNGAEDDLNKAVAINPRPNYYNLRAMCRFERKSYSGAIQDWTKCIEMKSSDPMFWFNRGVAKRLKGDPKGAVDDLTRAIDLNDNDGDFFKERSLAYTAMGDKRKAGLDMDESFEKKREIAAKVRRPTEQRVMHMRKVAVTNTTIIAGAPAKKNRDSRSSGGRGRKGSGARKGTRGKSATRNRSSTGGKRGKKR